MVDCIFCKIAGKEIPSEILYEDEQVVAFADIVPQAPVHILIIPKKHIPSLAQLTEADEALMGHVVVVAKKLAEQKGLDTGYRLVTNCGESAGQSVMHIHFHLLGGRSFQWPPG